MKTKKDTMDVNNITYINDYPSLGLGAEAVTQKLLSPPQPTLSGSMLVSHFYSYPTLILYPIPNQVMAPPVRKSRWDWEG